LRLLPPLLRIILGFQGRIISELMGRIRCQCQPVLSIPE